MPQTLVQKFGVAALRGVARNKSIAEFQLEPKIHDPQVVDGMLAQLTPDERRKFRVKAEFFPSIELCSVGEWSMSVSQAAIPTRVSCATPNVHVPAPPLLPECCSAVSGGAVKCICIMLLDTHHEYNAWCS